MWYSPQDDRFFNSLGSPLVTNYINSMDNYGTFKFIVADISIHNKDGRGSDLSALYFWTLMCTVADIKM